MIKATYSRTQSMLNGDYRDKAYSVLPLQFTFRREPTDVNSLLSLSQLCWFCIIAVADMIVTSTYDGY